MSLSYQIGERTLRVRVESESDGFARVTVTPAEGEGEERVFRARYVLLGGTRALLELDGRQTIVHVAAGDDAHHVSILGEHHAVVPPEILEKRRKSGAGSADAGGHITPPMPGQVIKVMVQAGDVVAKGQAVVVIMAMKMETTLTAPYDGKVTEVRAVEGAQVKPGDLLVDIEAA